VSEHVFVDDRSSGDAFVRMRKLAMLVRAHHIQPDIYSGWTLVYEIEDSRVTENMKGIMWL
jgi:hypothetical protein